MSKLHQAALGLARLGCAVFPYQPRGKNPVSRDGFKAATTNVSHIDTWWSAGPDCNIGIATGTPSGFWVLDIDGDEGEASLRKFEEANWPLPSTVEAITGKGRHCYFRIGEHGTVGSSAGQIADGLDIRGDGGYVLAPPSVHPSGRAYAWSVDSAKDFADAPDWLHALINANDIGGKGKPLAHWHETLTKRIGDGTRNVTLTSIAGKLIHEGVEKPSIEDSAFGLASATRVFKWVSYFCYNWRTAFKSVSGKRGASTMWATLFIIVLVLAAVLNLVAIVTEYASPES